MLYYLTNLYLLKRYEDIQYHKYLNYNIDSYDSTKKCFDANIYKLKALALYRLNKDFNRIIKNLNDAFLIFENENVYHGIALISFIKATITYEKFKES